MSPTDGGIDPQLVCAHVFPYLRFWRGRGRKQRLPLPLIINAIIATCPLPVVIGGVIFTSNPTPPSPLPFPFVLAALIGEGRRPRHILVG